MGNEFGELYITNETENELAGIQFNHNGGFYVDENKGSLKEEGFMISKNDSVLIAFSFTGAVIKPNGKEMIMALNFEGEDWKKDPEFLSEMVISNSRGESLEASFINKAFEIDEVYAEIEKAKAEAEEKIKAEAEAAEKAKAEAEAEADAAKKAQAEAEAKMAEEAKVKAEAEADMAALAKAKAEAEVENFSAAIVSSQAYITHTVPSSNTYLDSEVLLSSSKALTASSLTINTEAIDDMIAKLESNVKDLSKGQEEISMSIGVNEQNKKDNTEKLYVLQEQIKDFQTKIDQLNHELADDDANIAELTTEIKSLETGKKETEDKNDKIVDKIAEITADLYKAKNLFENLKKEKENEETQIKVLKERQEELKNNVDV